MNTHDNPATARGWPTSDSVRTAAPALPRKDKKLPRFVHPLVHARGAIRAYIGAQEARGQEVKKLRRIYKDLCVYITMHTDATP